MVPTCWASDGFSKPVMVSAKAKGDKGRTLQRLLLRVWYRGNDVLVANANELLFLVTNIYTTQLLCCVFSVLIADLLTKKERVLLVCVMSKAPSLSMVIGRCCLLALFLAKKLLGCLALVQLLLLLSGDVETNPGPTTGKLRCTRARPIDGCYYRLVG